jgi:hypothetical protein
MTVEEKEQFSNDVFELLLDGSFDGYSRLSLSVLITQKLNVYVSDKSMDEFRKYNKFKWADIMEIMNSRYCHYLESKVKNCFDNPQNKHETLSLLTLFANKKLLVDSPENNIELSSDKKSIQIKIIQDDTTNYFNE